MPNGNHKSITVSPLVKKILHEKKEDYRKKVGLSTLSYSAYIEMIQEQLP